MVSVPYRSPLLGIPILFSTLLPRSPYSVEDLDSIDFIEKNIRKLERAQLRTDPVPSKSRYFLPQITSHPSRISRYIGRLSKQ